MRQTVIANIGGRSVASGVVVDDVWETSPRHRSTPVKAFDLHVGALKQARELGAKFVCVKMYTPETDYQVIGYIGINDLLKTGVGFDNAGERFIYCPTEWLLAEKWEQTSLPIM